MNIKKILRDTLTIKFDKAFGLDIGDRSIEIIELEKVFKFSITTYGRIELEDGIVENGRILKQSVLAEKLKKLLKEVKPKKVSTNKVILSLPDSQVFVRCLEVDSKLKAGALTKEVVDQISVFLPINIDKTYWDYLERPLVDKNKKMIIFIGIAKDVANSYVRFCNSLGLEIVSLCIESLSLARTLLKSSNKQSLIIDIGARSTNLSFFDSNDKINMSLTIPKAGSDFTVAVADKLNINFEEAERLKIKLGFKEQKDNNIRPIILPIMDDILREIADAVSYYEGTFKQKLDDIFIIGGSALLPDILPLFKQNLKREVFLAKANSNINLGVFSSQDKDFLLFGNVFGLGMLGASGEFNDLNLLKKMPATELNTINKLSLFNLGYLSKVNTLRIIFNNKYVLIMLVILIGLIFAILIQQAQNFGYASVSATSF